MGTRALVPGFALDAELGGGAVGLGKLVDRSLGLRALSLWIVLE